MSIKIESKDEGKRLDLVVSLYFPQYSRTNVRKLLDAGQIQIEGQVEYRPNLKVAAGQTLEVATDVELERKALPEYKFDLEIVYQDADLVVVNKPVGLKVHPTAGNDNQTLLNALYYNLKGKLTAYGVNLINRIDQDTSGLVLAAISPHGAWWYADKFARQQIQKYYLAVVDARFAHKFGFKWTEDSIFLSFDQLTRRQTVVGQGEFAATRFMPVDTTRYAALLMVKPITGRTHQIRAHLEHLGFPIWGDVKYGGKDYPRLMLHAYQLQVEGPDNVVKKFEAPIPKEFETIFTPDEITPAVQKH